MQATLPVRRSKARSVKSAANQSASSPDALPVTEEIYSFIAVRDLLLAEAEEVTNEANLHRVWMANEFAERCLEPARPPYESQKLPAAEAAVERQRCRTIKLRIAELRTRVQRRAA
jgi:hypothetical protein